MKEKQFNRNWYIAASAAERNEFKQFLSNALNNATVSEPVTLVFEKSNGDLRTLLGSTNEQYNVLQSDSEAHNVYDLEKNDYRKFRYDSLISIKIPQ